jgi:serine/threonine-protein kinase
MLQRSAALLALLALGARPLPVAAEETNRVAAEALFVEGRKLLQAGRVDEGCAKLEASRALDPAVGTLLNLADCNERRGRSASAWAGFREAAARAARAGDARRAAEARRRAERLEPALPRLEIVAEGAPAGLSVTLDGRALLPAQIGVSMPVDPGAHAVVAEAPGYTRWAATVEAEPGARARVVLPPLVRAPTPTPTPTRRAPVAASADAERPPAARASTPPDVWILAGVGAAAAAVGAGFGAWALRAWGKVEEPCRDEGLCSGAERASAGSARRAGNVATGAFVVAGAALLGAGARLWLPRLTGSNASHALVPTFVPGGAGLLAQRSF